MKRVKGVNGECREQRVLGFPPPGVPTTCRGQRRQRGQKGSEGSKWRVKGSNEEQRGSKGCKWLTKGLPH